MIGTAVQSKRRLFTMDLDDETPTQLLSIARLHCKLALEHGRASTSVDRRCDIIGEIQSLRSVREALLESLC